MSSAHLVSRSSTTGIISLRIANSARTVSGAASETPSARASRASHSCFISWRIPFKVLASAGS